MVLDARWLATGAVTPRGGTPVVVRPIHGLRGPYATKAASRAERRRASRRGSVKAAAIVLLVFVFALPHLACGGGADDGAKAWCRDHPGWSGAGPSDYEGNPTDLTCGTDGSVQ
jgi:hypothetical protein